MDLTSGLVPTLLVIAVLLLARRVVGGRGLARSTGRIRVVERSGVTRGAAVAVVEVDARRFLIGATEHGVNLLSELGPRPAVEGELAAGAVAGGPAADADLHHEPAARLAPGELSLDRLRRLTVRTTVEEPLRALD